LRGVGLLRVDIDGNDYWVWGAVDCMSPLIVICGYNPILGDLFALAVPYNPAFQRSRAHHGLHYAGSSIAVVLVGPLYRRERLSQMGAA